MKSTILVIDDQSSVRQLLQEYLTEQGFKVYTAIDGQNALYMARHEPPDLILLDIMMPKMDGYQFLRQYRQERQTPIIIITAREEETDAVLGLELGADDYVTKPFRMRELVARIQAVLRRNQGFSQRFEVYRQGDILLDEQTHTVTVKEQPVSLTPIEFALLVELIRSAGRVRLHSDLLTTVWGAEYRDDVTVLRAAIYRLRHKVEPDPSNPNFIRTESGIGYSFHIPDTASNHTSPPALETFQNQNSPRLVPRFAVTGDGGA